MLNVNGLFDDAGGWGNHVRPFAAALNRLESVAMVNWGKPASGRFPELRALEAAALPAAPAAAGVGIGPPEHMCSVLGAPRIFSSVLETTEIPARHRSQLTGAEMILVPSAWGCGIVMDSAIECERIRVVPEGVDVKRFAPVSCKPTANRPFRFVSVAKWEVRKALDQLVAVFCRDFDPAEPVELCLHTWWPHSEDRNAWPIVRRECENAGQAGANIRVSGLGSPEFVVSLLQSADAFVLPTRAEGWGLPIIEAMACGLPCIVTNYGGHLEYAHADNCHLIDVERMISVSDPRFFPGGEIWGEWAQPDLDHLGALMRRVVSEPQEAKALGCRAREEVQRYWTWDHAAEKARAAIDELR